MNCPFCKQQIPADQVPIEHMVECSRKESQEMDKFLAGLFHAPVRRSSL